MSEVRRVHEIPVHILQEFIIILRTNEDFIGEGKVRDYYIIKNEKFATILYDDDKIAFIANFVKDDMNNWFFVDKIAIRDSLKGYINPKIVAQFAPQELEEESTEPTEEIKE